MCGIVGYIGSKRVVPLILDGLKRLEYRGYDSAGIAVVGEDGLSLIHISIEQLDFSAEDYPPRSVRAQISHAKNNGITPDIMETDAQQARDKDREDVATIFRTYDAMLRKANALDFDDLLLRAGELLREHPKVREAWNARFQYLMVDEFQDTNRAQEELSLIHI